MVFKRRLRRRQARIDVCQQIQRRRRVRVGDNDVKGALEEVQTIFRRARARLADTADWSHWQSLIMVLQSSPPPAHPMWDGLIAGYTLTLGFTIRVGLEVGGEPSI